MRSNATGTKSIRRNESAAEQVETFLASLDHPLKQEVSALRRVILGADPSIAEMIKWNAPSFYTSEHFATMHLRSQDRVQIIMHLGAKTRASLTSNIAIADPEAILEWLAKDRAMATFRTMDEIEARRSSFTQIIRQWIRYV